MNRDALKKHIELYRKTEDIIRVLDSDYGINIWDSTRPNFYNNYNLLIHNLLVEIFGETKVETLEDYLFEQTDISFDKLCEILEVNETN